jgi:hypothetical protein
MVISLAALQDMVLFMDVAGAPRVLFSPMRQPAVTDYKHVKRHFKPK